MKKCLTLIALAVMALTAMATELTVFDGTATNVNVPVRSSYYDWSPQYCQVIYPAEQIADLQGKEITSVKFYIANENGNTMSGGKMGLYLGTTTETSYGWDPAYIQGLTKVGEIAMTSGETEVVIDIEPWLYNGDNLVLQTLVEEDGAYSGDTYFYGVNAEAYCAVYGGTYTTNPEAFYPKTTFTYDGGDVPDPGITLLSQANALEDNEEFTFNGDAVVTYQVGNYLFLRDESGYGQVRGALDGTFQNGQVLTPGWEATKTSNDGWVWYTDAAGISASGETNVELAAPQELTGAPDESMINAYVYIEKVTLGMFPPRSFRLPDNTTISKTEVICGVNWDLNNTVTLYGIICKVDGTLKFNAVGMHTYVEPTVLRGDADDDGEVTIADVSTLVDYLLGNPVDPFNALNADADEDGEIAIADVSALIDYLLNGTWD